LRDHLEEGGLTNHAETAGQLPGEHSAAGQIGDEHQCNYINDGISSVEKSYPQKAQIQTLHKGGGVKGSDRRKERECIFWIAWVIGIVWVIV